MREIRRRRAAFAAVPPPGTWRWLSPPALTPHRRKPITVEANTDTGSCRALEIREPHSVRCWPDDADGPVVASHSKVAFTFETIVSGNTPPPPPRRRNVRATRTTAPSAPSNDRQDPRRPRYALGEMATRRDPRIERYTGPKHGSPAARATGCAEAVGRVAVRSRRGVDRRCVGRGGRIVLVHPAAAPLPATPRAWLDAYEAAAIDNPARVCSELFEPRLARAYGKALHSSCRSYFSHITSLSVVVRRVFVDGRTAVLELHQTVHPRDWAVVLSHRSQGWQAVDLLDGSLVR